MARHAATDGRRRPSRTIFAIASALGAVIVALTAFIALRGAATSPPSHGLGSATTTAPPAASSAKPATTTPASDPASTTTTTTAPIPGPAGPGFVAGQVTAVGDSVMLDYQDPLKSSIPGAKVDATVSRQWSDGETLLQTLKADGQLGADVVVGLGTNGPITDVDFNNMMAILGGASRVVFVNVHVDRPWQDPNNAVLASGASRYHNVVVADWATLAAQNPQWFGADGTHLGIDGPGANALATLVASTLANG
jgi:hypothetical protein